MVQVYQKGEQMDKVFAIVFKIAQQLIADGLLTFDDEGIHITIPWPKLPGLFAVAQS